MKTLIVAVVLVIGFTSCSKEEQAVETTTQSKPTFVRIEAVNTEGEVIYSDVSVVR